MGQQNVFWSKNKRVNPKAFEREKEIREEKVMDEKREKMIEMIKKCLQLAENNPSKEEAAAAALKAQELMARYRIEETEVMNEIKEETIEAVVSRTGRGKKWKYRLGEVIARNFRCKCYFKGAWGVAFYGFQSEAEAAKQVFEFLFQAGNKLARKQVYEYRKNGGNTSGIYNSYCLGFLTGIQERLERQSVALMIVVPKKVEAEYKAYSKSFGTKNTCFTAGLQVDADVYRAGKQDAKELLDGRHLETSQESTLTAV